MKLTKKAFIAWLESQPPRTRFITKSDADCPLAAYSGERVYYRADIVDGLTAWEKADWDVCGSTNPAKWVREFVAEVDRRKSITAAQALELLR